MAAGSALERVAAWSWRVLSSLVHPQEAEQERLLEQQTDQLVARLRESYGEEVLAQRLKHLRASQLIRSPRLEERVLAIQRLVQGDSSLEIAPSWSELPGLLPTLRQQVEEQCNRSAASEADYRVESRRRGLPYERLEGTLQRQYARSLATPATELLKPSGLAEVIGQERAKQALWAKLASPYPQHVLLYGPPGTGKSTLARLVFAQVKQQAQASSSRGKSPFGPDSPFVEVDGSSLPAAIGRGDLADPFFGSVHDPVFQGGRPELAAAGLPDPHLGLVTQAQGGVLFIDHIDAAPAAVLMRLLGILDRRRVYLPSAYYDPTRPSFTPAVRRLFEEGAPADFLLIGATDRLPSQLPAALRSRCAEICLEPLLPSHVRAIVEQSARKLGVTCEPAVAEQISRQTTDARRATQMLLDAFGLAHLAGENQIRVATLADALNQGGMGRVDGRAALVGGRECRCVHPPQLAVGRAHGLVVTGWVGSVLGIEALAWPAHAPGGGQVRFNEAAGQMARDAVFTSLSLLRRLSSQPVDDWDIHVNILGGGQVDGPSLGVPVLLAIASALWNQPLPQDLVATGEVSLSGELYPVGGIVPKLIAAWQTGFRLAAVPARQREEVPDELRRDGPSWDVRFVERIDDLRELCFPNRQP